MHCRQLVTISGNRRACVFVPLVVSSSYSMSLEIRDIYKSMSSTLYTSSTFFRFLNSARLFYYSKMRRSYGLNSAIFL